MLNTFGLGSSGGVVIAEMIPDSIEVEFLDDDLTLEIEFLDDSETLEIEFP